MDVYFSVFTKTWVRIVSVSSQELSNDMLPISAWETIHPFLSCGSEGLCLYDKQNISVIVNFARATMPWKMAVFSI